MLAKEFVFALKQYYSANVTIEVAKTKENFCERISNPDFIKPLLILLRRTFLQVFGKNLNVTPRLFLSAYLCIWADFLHQDDEEECHLYSLAMELLTAFEQLCCLLKKSELFDGEADVHDLSYLLQLFADKWHSYKSTFLAWKKEDAKCLIAHHIDVYVQVALSRQEMLLSDSDGLPKFFAEVRHQLLQIGGPAAIQKLNMELQANGVSHSTAKEILETSSSSDHKLPSSSSSSSCSSSSATPVNDTSKDDIVSMQSSVVDEKLKRNEEQNFENVRIRTEKLQYVYAQARLAYESVCDLGFESLRKNAFADLRIVAERAFWDVFKEELDHSPPNYFRVGSLLDDIKDILKDCVPKDKHFAEELNGTLDWEILRHSPSLPLLRNFVVYVMTKVMDLCSPARTEAYKSTMLEMCAALDSDSIASTEINTLIVTTFQTLMMNLQQLTDEVDSFRRKLLLLNMKPNAVRLQQMYVSSAIGTGKLTFVKTRHWIENCIQRHFSESTSRSLDYVDVVREAFLDTLQASVGATSVSLPETLHFDVENIVHIQNKIQHITLVSAVINIAASICNEKRLSLSKAELTELKTKLDEVFTRKDVGLPVIAETVLDFLRLCMSTSSRLSSASSSILPQDEELLRAMLRKTADTEDKVFMTFRGKFIATIARFCQKTPPADELTLFTSSTISLVESDVRYIGNCVRRLFLNQIAVYGVHYSSLVLGVMLHCAESEAEQSEEVSSTMHCKSNAVGSTSTLAPNGDTAVHSTQNEIQVDPNNDCPD